MQHFLLALNFLFFFCPKTPSQDAGTEVVNAKNSGGAAIAAADVAVAPVSSTADSVTIAISISTDDQAGVQSAVDELLRGGGSDGDGGGRAAVGSKTEKGMKAGGGGRRTSTVVDTWGCRSQLPGEGQAAVTTRQMDDP